MLDDDTSILILLQAKSRSMDCLKFMIPFWMMHRELRTLEKLWLRFSSSTMRSVSGLRVAAIVISTVTVESWFVRRGAHYLTGQSASGWERKLPCYQNLELSFSMVKPVVVSRSAGFSMPGHQNQLYALVFLRPLQSIPRI